MGLSQLDTRHSRSVVHFAQLLLRIGLMNLKVILRNRDSGLNRGVPMAYNFDPNAGRVKTSCGCGGIGRRAGFRCQWGQPRGGSNPLIRTSLKKTRSKLKSTSVYLRVGLATPPVTGAVAFSSGVIPSTRSCSTANSLNFEFGNGL